MIELIFNCFFFFEFSADSPTLIIISDSQTDTDIDYTNKNSSCLSDSSGSTDDADNRNQTLLSQALNALQVEQVRTELTSQHPSLQGSITIANHNIGDILNPENDEFDIDSQLRLQREENASGRLTLSANEITDQTKRTQQLDQGNIDHHVREKQMKLVDKQIELQQLLIEEAKERLVEAKLRRKTIATERASAEIGLLLKKIKLNASYKND